MVKKMSQSDKETDLDGAQCVVEAAINSIGLGFDICCDLSLKYCKASSSRLIVIDDEDQVRNVELPGDIFIPNVPISIKCSDFNWSRNKLFSDFLSFDEMSELFNQELSLSGKTPTGHFNAAFGLSGVWHRDAADTKTLAFAGYSITLCNIVYETSKLVLCDHVKHDVPPSWDPAALARFIEKYGTHVLVGLKVGGTDIIYAKQLNKYPIQPADAQKRWKEIADKVLIALDEGHYTNDLVGLDWMEKVHGVESIRRRKGGSGKKISSRMWWQSSLSYTGWRRLVLSQPDVISMSFIPITSMLSGVNGSEYLTYAINLYLRYKPPIEELRQFLEFQLPRRWAPVFSELAFGTGRRPKNTASSKFSFVGPKLCVNTTPVMLLVFVELLLSKRSIILMKILLFLYSASHSEKVDVGKKLVTGLRLSLEGKKSNHLAIHLQHLSYLPKAFQLDDIPNAYEPAYVDRRFYEKFQFKSLSHCCTAPVESENDSSVVTGAHFEVRDVDHKKVLFLILHFSDVAGATLVKNPEWDGSHGRIQKSGTISTLIRTSFPSLQNLQPDTETHKLLKFVDTTEITRGPQDLPGYWVVSGARLTVDNGKITLRVKYSLLKIKIPNEAAEEVFWE
ncbi:hypothetical protein RIF29_06666 [Crotalaria pallida]|uniref:MACPF domain-containing protein n=1 Tax=Crotalaria pallida TaxID=3830 RepID=A0AAN9PB12_CROPI